MKTAFGRAIRGAKFLHARLPRIIILSLMTALFVSQTAPSLPVRADDLHGDFHDDFAFGDFSHFGEFGDSQFGSFPGQNPQQMAVNRLVDNVNEGVDVFGPVSAVDITQVLVFPELDAEISIEAFDDHDVQHEQQEDNESGGGGRFRSQKPNRQGAQNPKNLKRTADEKKKRMRATADQFSKLLLGMGAQSMNTGLCRIDVSSGSAALVIERDGVVSILDLHDDRHGGVSLNVSGRAVAMHPGDEIVLSSKSNATFADVHKDSLPRVAVRNVKKIGTGAITAYQAEFSIPHCLASNLEFRRVLRSESTEGRLFAHKIMKTAVIVNMITNSHGQYKPVKSEGSPI